MNVICGNELGCDASELLEEYEKKKGAFPRNLIDSIRAVCFSDLIWRHDSSEPAVRARGVVWVIGLTHVGMELLAAIRADNGDGKIVGAWLHGISPVSSEDQRRLTDRQSTRAMT